MNGHHIHNQQITINNPEFLFPTKVISSHDRNFGSYRNEMIQWMDNYIIEHQTIQASNCGGYQSIASLTINQSFIPYFERISEQIFSTVDFYIKDTNLDKLDICNMWFNYNYQNCYNTTHIHPGAVLSGVLWVQIPDNDAVLGFECPNAYASDVINKVTNRQFNPSEWNEHITLM